MTHIVATKLFKINDRKHFQSIKQIHRLLIEIIEPLEKTLWNNNVLKCIKIPNRADQSHSFYKDLFN